MSITRKRAQRDTRGAIYVEFLIAFLPVFVFFECLAQFADMLGAKLIVQHAAYRAARAAAVVLGDSCERYEKRSKLYDIRVAGERILAADASISKSSFEVETPSGRSHGAPATVRVQATYRCAYPLADRILCGALSLTPSRELAAAATMPVFLPPYATAAAEGCDQ